MLKLIVSFDIPGLADGVYRVRAKGFLAASLWWADADGALADWSAFAYIPIAPSGEGAFRFCGRRAVPPGASHVLVRAVRPDLCVWEGALVPLPPGYAGIREERREGLKLCIMSDLHLTREAGRIRRALGRAADSDALLLTGDLVNDGLPEQYRLLRSCLEELPAGLPVFVVNGNHDLPPAPLPATGQEEEYPVFLQWLGRRAGDQGLLWNQDGSGAYSVRLGSAEIIGLNAVSHWRRFTFPEGRQLRFLEDRLEKTRDSAAWRLVLCHAPLLSHNPQRSPGDTPYLNRDRELQRILNGQERVIFISGHTHFSPNVPEGCVEYEAGARRLYLNDGSVRPTVMGQGKTPGQAGKQKPDFVGELIPGEWTSGVYWELHLEENGAGAIELCARSVYSGRRYPRGYYRFP